MVSNCGYVLFNGFGYDWKTHLCFFCWFWICFFDGFGYVFFFYDFVYGFGNGFGQNRTKIVKQSFLGTLVAFTIFFKDFFPHLFDVLFFYDFASKSGSVVGKGFWERETLPKSIKIKNHIQNHKKHKPFSQP